MKRKRLAWLLTAIFGPVAIALLISLVSHGQTKVDSATQVRNKSIVAVEWSKCVGSGTTSGTFKNPCTGLIENIMWKWDCGGMEMYRLRQSDGTLGAPFIAVPAIDSTTVNNAHWTKQPVVLPNGAGTQLR